MSGGSASMDVIEEEEGEGRRSKHDRETDAVSLPPLRLSWPPSSQS